MSARRSAQRQGSDGVRVLLGALADDCEQTSEIVAPVGAELSLVVDGRVVWTGRAGAAEGEVK